MLPQHRIVLLVICVSFLALPLLLYGSSYTNWASLGTLVAPQPLDLARSQTPSQVLFPPRLAGDDHSWIAENERTISSLLHCIEDSSCGQNQTKVVILAASPFRGLLHGENGGEAIWANSTVIALRRMGYSFLYSINRERTSRLYDVFCTLRLSSWLTCPTRVHPRATGRTYKPAHGTGASAAQPPAFPSLSTTMPFPRIFHPPSQDWLSPLIVVSKGLVSVANCVPFPYVNAALSAGLVLLELIQTVGKSSEDLKYLAQSVVSIMQLLREEMASHSAVQDTRFRELCTEFSMHMSQLSRDIESLSKERSSSKLKKYLGSPRMRDEITDFTRRVDDLRANTTFVAAIGTRMDLVEIANGVAAVESKISTIQQDLTSLTQTKATGLSSELARFEEDVGPISLDGVAIVFSLIQFHALKLGDIHVDFHSARPAEFEVYLRRHQRRKIGWTDYRATVQGCIRTVRVYQGSDPVEVSNITVFVIPFLILVLEIVVERFPGFAGGEVAIADFAELAISPDYYKFAGSRRFALVNVPDGKLLLSHIEPEISFGLPSKDPPFMDWFVSVSPEDLTYGGFGLRRLQDSQGSMEDLLRSLTTLRRRSHWLMGPITGVTIHHLLTSRGCVYRMINPAAGWPLHWLPAAHLPEQEIMCPDSWSVLYNYYPRAPEIGSQEEDSWPCCPPFPTLAQAAEPGWTHFIVPLIGNIGKTRNWISHLDQRLHCGYFLNASVSFGASVPDISAAWLAQSSSIISNSHGRFDGSDVSEFCIRAYHSQHSQSPLNPHPNEATSTSLRLTWEMVLAAENTATTPESLTILSHLPDQLHVYVQVPSVDGGRVAEPRIYWSADANSVETGCIPRRALRIKMRWGVDMDLDSWLPHHYDVVKSSQRNHGFDPTSTAAAEALRLPLLLIPDPEALEEYGEESAEPELDWSGFHELDPHTMEAAPVQLDLEATGDAN
ncbi:hypothetical protein FB451DRAFT_1536679 [Mycena latifolia]|nr:hypothetical protein FB451DRAFT_1536679 [Mycena latifolia]